ncbi:MAG: response regulator [Phycisphaerales bacterium]|jgi:FixJ family two-component response regulator
MSELEPTVFIVDHDVEVQGALRRLLESVRLRVETFATAAAFLEKHGSSRCGCVILEMRLQDMSGVELQRRLRREGCRIPMIFVTDHGDVPTAVQTMREGAFHFLQKPVNEQYLLDQVHAAIERDLADRREEAERRAAGARFGDLSTRERDVLAEIVAGKTNKQMAQQFGVTVKTVEFHRANIMKKVGVDSLVELVCLLLKSGGDSRGTVVNPREYVELSDEAASVRGRFHGGVRHRGSEKEDKRPGHGQLDMCDRNRK